MIARSPGNLPGIYLLNEEGDHFVLFFIFQLDA